MVLIRFCTRFNPTITRLSILVFVVMTTVNYTVKYLILNVKERTMSLKSRDKDDFPAFPGISYVRPLKTKTLYPTATSASYIINNQNLCRRGKKVSCVIMVHTAPAHRRRREIMRVSWLNTTYYYPENIVVIYLVGTTSKPNIQQALYDENSTYGDIIQGDFIDSYRNLSNKGIMGFRWITENCRHADIVLKIDDDIFINLFKLFDDLLHLKKRRKFIYCNRSPGNSMPLNRDIGYKWRVNEAEFRGFNTFPHMYCSGAAVFLSTDLIPALYHAAFSTPFFWIDDMYLFGMLPSKVPDVTYGSFYKNFSYHYTAGFDCYKKKGRDCQYLIVDVPFMKVITLWEQVMKDRKVLLSQNKI